MDVPKSGLQYMTTGPEAGRCLHSCLPGGSLSLWSARRLYVICTGAATASACSRLHDVSHFVFPALP